MIAFEKSGIIKSDIPAIIGYQPYPEAKEILMDQAEYKKARYLPMEFTGT